MKNFLVCAVFSVAAFVSVFPSPYTPMPPRPKAKVVLGTFPTLPLGVKK